jgi:adenosine kinase
MSKVLVSGSLAYDRIMDFPGNFTDNVLASKIHSLNVSFTIEKLSENFGGTAGNVAYNLGLLGEEPDLIGTVGNDFGKYGAHLKEHGVGMNMLQIVPNDTTSSAYVFTDRDDNQIAAFYPGAGRLPYEGNIDTEGHAYAIVGAGNILDMATLTEKYKATGVKYLYDPGQQISVLSKEALCAQITGAWGVFANDYELALIIKKTGWQEKALLEHTELIVTTFGAKGSIILTKERSYEIAAVHSTTLVDPTGAGDAHRAGFMKGILAGLPLDTAGRLASTVATYAVEVYGTQTHSFTIDQLKMRYKEAYGEALAI